MMRLLLLSAILLLPTALTLADDPSNYSVDIKHFSGTLLSEKKSRFILTSENEKFRMSDSINQRVIQRKMAGALTYITLETGLNSGHKERGDFTKHLENTRYLNIESSEIKSISEKIKNSSDPVLETEKFVNSWIKKKISGIPIMSAKNIYNSRSGDCTEHTILAIAILRSIGIPSQAVVGMVASEEFDGKKNVFVFHMWAESRVNGTWVLMDATRPGKKYYNRYISFSHHSLKSESPVSYLRAVSAIQNLQVEYVNEAKP